MTTHMKRRLRPGHASCRAPARGALRLLMLSPAGLGALLALTLTPAALAAQAELIPATALNPRPAIHGFDPTFEEVVGGGERLLTVLGSSFVADALVRVDGEARTTYFVDDGRLRFISPTRDRDRGRVLSITVVNPEPGGGESEPRGLPVLYPEPTLNTLDPSEVVRGQSSPVLVRLRGSKMVPGTLAVVNGVERPTSYAPQVASLTLSPQDLEAGPSLDIMARNPAPGGGESGPLSLRVVNPAPTLTAVDPDVLEPPASGNRLRVTGRDFVPFTSAFDGSVVHWNGAPRATTYVSRTELQVTLLPEDLLTPGTARLGVVNRGPGGGTSAELPVEVREDQTNPVPLVTSIEPARLVRTEVTRISLRIRGSGFAEGAAIRYAGGQLPTHRISDTELLVIELGGAYWSRRSFLDFWVRNPAPGGGDSETLRLEILNPVPRIDEVEPGGLEVGAGGALLRISGAGFQSQLDFDPPTVVRWNGEERPATIRGWGSIDVELSAQDLATPGVGRLTASNPAPGGGTSNEFPVEIRGADNPVPAITAVELTREGRRPGYVLTVRGSGFLPASRLRWDGRELDTTLQAEDTLRAFVPPGLVNPRRAERFTVTVWNPAPGGGTSAGFEVSLD